MYNDTSIERHYRELEATEIFNETLIDRLPVGIVVLDQRGYVVKYNREEETMTRRRRQDVIGRSFFEDVARCTNHPRVAGVFRAGMLAGELAAEIETSFDLPFLPRPRDVRIRMQSFRLGGQVFGVFLVEDITLRKELEREREKLFAMLMHDLKNPLQGILGYVSLLQIGAMGEIARQEQKDALAAIESSSLRLRDLLATSLDEMSGQAPKKHLVNLHALVLSAIGNALPEARMRGLQLRYRGELFERAEFPIEAFAIHGQVEQLARVIDNLIGNALKYANTRIDLDLVTQDGFHHFTVGDDGCGIAAEHHQKVFESGFQVPGSLPGHGLGLAGARDITLAHNGRLELNSAAGAGALFRLILPVQRT